MRLGVKFNAPVGRADLEDYVRHLEIDVTCSDEEGENEYVVGKLAVDQIRWADAQTDDVPLFAICDNDSQGMDNLYEILTEGEEDFRSDLGIDEEVTNHVLFLYGAVFHPSIHPYRQGILDAAYRLFGDDSLAVTWRDTTGLSLSQLAELGFAKVARTKLVFRHNARQTSFADAHPRGIDTIEAVAEEGHEEWVTQQWRQLMGPGGSQEEEGDEE
jgi:hypothetical protein